MKALWIAVLGLVLAAAPLAAQDHPTEKNKARDELSITSKVKVGNYVLDAGSYAIACDRKQLTFTRISDHQTIALPCKGKDLGRKVEATALYTTLDSSGLRVADKLLLRGSNVEHVF